jgi:hypothetical protein
MIEDRYGDVRGPDPGEPATSVSRVHSGKRRTNGYVMLDGSPWFRVSVTLCWLITPLPERSRGPGYDVGSCPGW